MTDKKEIIIDGVNVKDCRRRIGKNSYCRYFKRPCAENNFNCIWKQNERLKEENKRLQEEIKSLQYNMAVYSTNDIDNVATLFAKDKAILEQKCALLEAYKNTYYQQTLDDEIKINEGNYIQFYTN